MSVRELFGVLVRTVGIWELANGLPDLVAGLTASTEFTFLHGIVNIVTGLILFFLADGLTQTAYRNLPE